MILDVFSRGRHVLTPSRLAFLLMALLLLALLATGFIWSTVGPIQVGAFSLLTIHGALAIGLAVLLVWHVLVRRWILEVPSARDRRAMLRAAAASAAGLALWGVAGPVKAALALSGARRRFTGSYETGSFSGRFPVTSWLFDRPPPVEVASWTLIVDGAVERSLRLSYHELRAMPSEVRVATLDCTGGWYTRQRWQGVPLGRLLEQAGVAPEADSVTVEAVSGYARRFGLEETERLLLATAVAGGLLDHGHGFPVRLVAPGYRGFDWVKWVTRVTVNTTGQLWQPPVPLQ